MTLNPRLEDIACPYCGARSRTAFAEERGFVAQRCGACRFLYVSPRPRLDDIDEAVRTGAHGEHADRLDVAARRVAAKVRHYRSVLGRMFVDHWERGKPIDWLDVGAGYGELVEAVSRLAPEGSSIEGIEPMRPKAEAARARGLRVVEGYLTLDHAKVDVVSFVDVFSHIPDFRAFLGDVRAVLKPSGEIFMETGNLADVCSRAEFPDELGLPDHLTFAGESHLRGYLGECGFEIVSVHRIRVDGFVGVAKALAKKALGRPASVRPPYSSRYRRILLRARLRAG